MTKGFSKLREAVEDRVAWHAVIQRVAKSRTQLRDWTIKSGAAKVSWPGNGSKKLQISIALLPSPAYFTFCKTEMITPCPSRLDFQVIMIITLFHLSSETKDILPLGCFHSFSTRFSKPIFCHQKLAKGFIFHFSVCLAFPYYHAISPKYILLLILVNHNFLPPALTRKLYNTGPVISLPNSS